MAETYDELDKEIKEMFRESNEKQDIGLFHETIWPAVVRCEVFFRKSKDIRALELQASLLFEMGDNIYRGQYLRDAYVTCKRILEIDPNKKAARHTIKNHIMPFFKRDYSYMEKIIKTDKDKKAYDELIKSQNNIEIELNSYFLECKKDEFILFCDDNVNNWEAWPKIIDKEK
jgi:hypothetical protein